MKYLLIIAAISLNVASPVFAQWNVGGLLTLNGATVNVDPEPSSENYSTRVLFGIGGVADRQLSENIVLHLEPMYLKKGTKIEEDGDEINYTVAYFEIPVLFKYGFQSESAIKPYAMAGPTMGFLLSANTEGNNGSKSDIKDLVNNFELGAAFGGGINIPRGNTTLFAEARYALGLSNTNAETDDNEATVKNRGIQAVFGITVPFKR